MSKESSYWMADKACSQAESAVKDLGDAVSRLTVQINAIGLYWKGESGTAMVGGLEDWKAQLNTLRWRMNQLSSEMRASQRCDAGLWAEQEAGH